MVLLLRGRTARYRLHQLDEFVAAQVARRHRSDFAMRGASTVDCWRPPPALLHVVRRSSASCVSVDRVASTRMITFISAPRERDNEVGWREALARLAALVE